MDAIYDPQRSLLSERYPGTFATQVCVPPANLVDKPPELSFADAACLPTFHGYSEDMDLPGITYEVERITKVNWDVPS